MKNLLKNTTAALVLTAAFASSASAMVSSDLNNDVRWVLGGDSQISISENNGVVTITGYYGDAGDQAAALAVLNSTEGVEKVINLAFPST